MRMVSSPAAGSSQGARWRDFVAPCWRVTTMLSSRDFTRLAAERVRRGASCHAPTYCLASRILRAVPKRTDIKKILLIGSGPIVIGQACEFDYSGTQACKALREEGYEVV